MTLQLFIIFAMLALGELVVFITGVKIPSSIFGMLFLTIFLKVGWIKLHWVKDVSDFLTRNLAFFFIPPGVKLMLYFGVIKAQFVPIISALIGSTVLVFITTAVAYKITRKYISKRK
ncbi:MAG: CidA/LrgA family protein [Paludibacteraceae bacterium]|nr:CidA/LrgA family protein [Paludibacteraceae bacterium]